MRGIIVKSLLLIALCVSVEQVKAQQAEKCGIGKLKSELIKTHGIDAWNETIHANYKYTALKVTSTENDTIPIVFHIVLNTAQIEKLGGAAGIKNYVELQVKYLNRDFNAMNSDSNSIPAAFKPFFGNAHIRFASPHTAPGGQATEGYEIVKTDAAGFELKGSWGSTYAFSNAKYSKYEGADAWDPTVYLNVWIINPLENGKSSTYLGLTMPPYLQMQAIYNIPAAELGIILNYNKVWKAGFLGRTLVHEVGHYFGLRHIWGDDAGECPNTVGEDDGIEDTPPQANFNYGCYTFPKYDACTKTGSGVMYMNYMDYTDDECQVMFSKGQAARMRSDVELFGPSHALTQHSSVLGYPSGQNAEDFTIYPIPAHDKLNVKFPITSKGLNNIVIINSFGQVMRTETYNPQQGFYYFDLTGMSKGMYMMKLMFTDKTVIRKVVLE